METVFPEIKPKFLKKITLAVKRVFGQNILLLSRKNKLPNLAFFRKIDSPYEFQIYSVNVPLTLRCSQLSVCNEMTGGLARSRFLL